MNVYLKIISVVLILLGISMVLGAHYINTQVAQGKILISEGQAKLDRSENEVLLSVPVVPEVFGTIVNEERESARKKIAAGDQEIAHYTNMAQNLQIGGYFLIVLSLGFVWFSFRRRT